MRKTKQIKRKEIIFEPDEWARIEADAAKLNLKTSEYIRRMVLPVLAHRLLLTPEARMKNITAEQVLSGILQSVAIPGGRKK